MIKVVQINELFFIMKDSFWDTSCINMNSWFKAVCLYRSMENSKWALDNFCNSLVCPVLSQSILGTNTCSTNTHWNSNLAMEPVNEIITSLCANRFILINSSLSFMEYYFLLYPYTPTTYIHSISSLNEILKYFCRQQSWRQGGLTNAFT